MTKQWMVSIQAEELTESAYIAPDGTAHIMKGYDGNVLIVPGETEQEARENADVPMGYYITFVSEYLEPDDDNPMAPNTVDVLPADYKVEPFLPSVPEASNV